MEEIKKIVQKTSGQLQKSTPKSSEVSVYSGSFDERVVVECGVRITKAFPSLPPEWHDIFTERCAELEISPDRLEAAVNHVIDNCVYPQPTIANFLSYDVTVKLYSYDEMLQKNHELSGKAFNYFTRLESGLYAANKDIEKFNLK